MSSVVEVKRAGNKPPLTTSDFEKLMKDDVSLVPLNGRLIVWDQSRAGKPLHLNIESDRLWTDALDRDSQAIHLNKLREIAKILDARVFGEEGEDFTEEDPDDPGRSRHPIASAVGFFVFALMVPMLAIMFVVRLPWMLWRVSRTLK